MEDGRREVGDRRQEIGDTGRRWEKGDGRQER